jgi:hypothetical protein
MERMTERWQSPMQLEETDVVYTWVDGNDPAHRSLLRAYSDTLDPSVDREGLNATRFQQHDELRYSLRSIEAYAPWVRRVYLVTNGQVPNWLNMRHDRLVLVRHDDIFANKPDLPTFNANAIDFNLHHISGLSKRFIYINDDIFFGRAVVPEDFISPSGGQYVCLEMNDIASRDQEQGNAYLRSLAYTQNALDALGGTVGLRSRTCHVPTLFDVDVLKELEALLPGEFARSSAMKFRTGKELQLHFLYSHYLLEIAAQGHRHIAKFLELPSRDYSFIALEPRPWPMFKRFVYVFLRKPKFFCINDHLSEPSRPVNLLLNIFLRSYFPRPSSFELA